jgi:hypothetical protein
MNLVDRRVKSPKKFRGFYMLFIPYQIYYFPPPAPLAPPALSEVPDPGFVPIPSVVEEPLLVEVPAPFTPEGFEVLLLEGFEIDGKLEGELLELLLELFEELPVLVLLFPPLLVEVDFVLLEGSFCALTIVDNAAVNIIILKIIFFILSFFTFKNNLWEIINVQAVKCGGS